LFHGQAGWRLAHQGEKLFLFIVHRITGGANWLGSRGHNVKRVRREKPNTESLGKNNANTKRFESIGIRLKGTSINMRLERQRPQGP